MCGIWDWQSTIVKDLNDSQDPKHTLFCRDLRAFSGVIFPSFDVFVAKARNYDIFVAKIYDYALIDSF